VQARRGWPPRPHLHGSLDCLANTRDCVCTNLQGASSQEVLQKLYASAIRGAVQDDSNRVATFWPVANPGILDISATPNRMLQSYIFGQANITPSVIHMDDSQKASKVQVRVAGVVLGSTGWCS
jgi:hypothetical protein